MFDGDSRGQITRLRYRQNPFEDPFRSVLTGVSEPLPGRPTVQLINLSGEIHAARSLAIGADLGQESQLQARADGLQARRVVGRFSS